MLGYEIGQLLDYLEGAGSAPDLLARFEFIFFRLLEDHRQPRALYAALGYDPSLFVDLVSRVYRGKDEPKREINEHDEALAHHAWWVLNQWSAMPGHRDDGTVDGEHLAAWVRALRVAGAGGPSQLAAVPEDERRAAYALGSTGWEVMSRIVVPRSRPGIIGATMLGLGRALDLILTGRAGSYSLWSAELLLHDHDGHFMPLAFAGSRSVERAAGRRKPIVRVKGRRMLYSITLRPLFFRDSTPRERVETILHELFHISPAFDGTLARTRRHARMGNW
jgi:hypothetical protein